MLGTARPSPEAAARSTCAWASSCGASAETGSQQETSGSPNCLLLAPCLRIQMRGGAFDWVVAGPLRLGVRHIFLIGQRKFRNTYFNQSKFMSIHVTIWCLNATLTHISCRIRVALGSHYGMDVRRHNVPPMCPSCTPMYPHVPCTHFRRYPPIRGPRPCNAPLR